MVVLLNYIVAIVQFPNGICLILNILVIMFCSTCKRASKTHPVSSTYNSWYPCPSHPHGQNIRASSKYQSLPLIFRQKQIHKYNSLTHYIEFIIGNENTIKSFYFHFISEDFNNISHYMLHLLETQQFW